MGTKFGEACVPFPLKMCFSIPYSAIQPNPIMFLHQFCSQNNRSVGDIETFVGYKVFERCRPLETLTSWRTQTIELETLIDQAKLKHF